MDTVHSPGHVTGPLATRTPASHSTWLAMALFALGLVLVVVALAGPGAFGFVSYRTSESGRAQIVGADIVGMSIVAPLSFLAGFRVLRGHLGATRLAIAPALFAAYDLAQLALGEEYFRYSGDVAVFFPFLVGGFTLAMVVAAGCCRIDSPPAAPGRVWSRGRDRMVGGILLALVAAIALGMHLPAYLDALSQRPHNLGYLETPTAFWVVKFLDLGIVIPAIAAIGFGLLRRRAWARRAAAPAMAFCALLASAVLAMAVAMVADHAPDGSTVGVAVWAVIAALLGWAAVDVQRVHAPKRTAVLAGSR